MIEETAKIIRCEDDIAWLETQRQTSCQACSANKACGTSVLSKWIGNKTIQVRALNPISAREGESVIVGMPESALLKGSLAVYLVPLLLMLAFAMLGKIVATQMLWTSEIAVGLFAVLGLFVAGVWLKRFSRSISNDKRYQPVILKRLSTGNSQAISFNHHQSNPVSN